MLINNMPVPDSFLEEEVRNDYTVSAGMKKVWAVQIQLLEELKRVCEKHHLTYFADSGTLIGAIRHQGYIPWDDDIDIVMMREDYRKLQEVAEKEFLYPVFLQNTYSENAFFKGYSRLMNLDTTAVSGHDEEKGFSHGICIDIFPLDRIPDDAKTFSRWKMQIKRLYSVLYAYAYSEKKPAGIMAVQANIKNAGLAFLKNAVDRYGYLRLFEKYEALCCKYNSAETERVSYIAYSRGKKKHLWRRCLFDASHEVPFEFTTINIPDGYDERLRVEYGDYMVMKRTGTAHGEMTALDAEGAFAGGPVGTDPFGSGAEPKGSVPTGPSLWLGEKPDWVTYEEITEVLHDAHASTAEQGMHFVALSQTAEETRKRLGEDGTFFVALAKTPDGQEIAGVGAISFYKKCKGWYGKGQPYGEIKMVGVRGKYKGQGISSALYRALEEYGFSRVSLLTMNTAEENRIVLDSNARHGWKMVDYRSWSRTDYYSPVMAKWADKCPFSETYLKMRYRLARRKTRILRRPDGKRRLL